MDIFAEKLRERAKQLGISNAEAARRIGLDERRYAHYASGRREPDLATLVNSSEILGTHPNWLLGVLNIEESNKERAELLERFKNAISEMTIEELELSVIQAEAIAAAKHKGR